MSERRRGRPAEIPESTILAIRTALAAGEPVATVARRHRVSRRYARDVLAGTRRPEAVEVPPEIEALDSVEGEFADEARELRELWGLLALAGTGLARDGR